MDSLQILIWAASVAVLVGVALAFLKSDSLAVVFGAIAGFAVFYFAVMLWAPQDATWANLTLGGFLVIALASRMKKPAPKEEGQAEPPGDAPDGEDRADDE